MSRSDEPVIDASMLMGWKYFKRLEPVLAGVRGAGCARDKAGNRELFFDQYISLILLYLFNPVVTSLRGIQAAGSLKKVQRTLGCGRSSLGSLSEAARVFDAELLRGVIDELAREVAPMDGHAALRDVPGILTLVDGTLLSALPRLAESMLRAGGQKRHKLHVQFELLKGPVSGELTDAKVSERGVLKAALRPGRVDVMDRGYFGLALFQEVIDAGSSLVCRVADNATFELIEDRPLTAGDRAAGVVGDRVVRLGCATRRGKLKDAMRLVEVACTPHKRHWKSSSSRGGPVQGDTILIATDLMELPAELVALIYRCRWQVEIFFRQLKHVLGCRHLLSHSTNGITIQCYCAIIACLLITLWTGRKPTLRTYEMVCFYFTGMADAQELQAHIQSLGPADAIAAN